MDPHRTVSLVLRPIAAALLVVYVLWNLFWLVQLQVPPSLLVAFTGLPCPTTGGTRSFMCLLRGQWWLSLAYNAMTVPLLALLAFCAIHLMIQVSGRRPLRLPDWTLWAWISLLGIAWVIKLSGPSDYW